jgi:hypothetical protein
MKRAVNVFHSCMTMAVGCRMRKHQGWREGNVVDVVGRQFHMTRAKLALVFPEIIDFTFFELRLRLRIRCMFSCSRPSM